MSNCRLTVVVDNKAAEGLVAEHGFSLLIETDEQTILFDTGEKKALLSNMEALKIKPEKISTLVLSHGHYDHTGGVAEMLKRNRKLEIYLHAGVFQPRYSLDEEKPVIVKMPLAAMEAVMHHPDNKTHWLTKPMELSSKVGISGPIPRVNDYEDTGGSFYLDPEGRETDTLKDDVAMWFKGDEGLVVCLGCCHSGLVNTLTRVTEITGEKRIALVLGGMHLLNASSKRLEKTVEALAAFDIKRIIACHCSGESAVEYLNAHLNADISMGQAGMIIEA